MDGGFEKFYYSSQDIFLKCQVLFLGGYLNDLTGSVVEESLKAIKMPLKMPKGTKPRSSLVWPGFPPSRIYSVQSFSLTEER